MKLRSSIDAWTWTLIAAVVGGGCGGSTDDDPKGMAGTGGAGLSGGSGGGAAVGGSGGTAVGGGGGTAVGGSAGTAASGGSAGTGGTGPLFECLNPTPVLGPDGRETGFVTCGDPSNQAASYRHRERVVDCAVVLPEPVSCPMAAGGCTSSSDCTERPYGFCQPYPGGYGCGCTYGCVRDGDCAAGQICSCGGAVGVCVESSCTTDADCGDGLCASHQIMPYCGGTGYSCQSAADECMTDADCVAGPCAFDGTRRFCQPGGCVPGRPFLIDGEARVAPAVARADWRDTLSAPETADLTPAARAALASYWLDAALLEHASVAAFARFVLQLLELGAPPELVIGAQAAIADETRHAQLCFQLASVYGGVVVGPGPLALDRALTDGGDLKTLLALVIREGCVGETVAALEAREALEHVTDPAVRAALDQIQADEGRHAALAWRFVRWVLSGSPELGAHVAEVFALEACRATQELLVPSAGDGLDLSGHGLLPERIRRALRRDAHAHVIPTLLAQTLGLASEPTAVLAS